MASQEKLKKKERAHDIMAKRLEIAEALSTRTVNELSRHTTHRSEERRYR